ncbi:putative tubulin--tyrosine ligase pby1 [Rhodotorula kratochvilovae]
MASAQKKQRTALVQYPDSQAYVVASVRTAFARQLADWQILAAPAEDGTRPDLQWSDYDELDWDTAMDDATLLNSFAIRKALIRKSNLAHTVALFLSKNPDSPLRQAAPQTFHFSCSFADELDELLMDDLYEVAQSFDAAEQGAEPKWWILKAALADKGNGIRLFNSRDMLEEIFQEFEPESSDEEEEDEDDEAEDRPQASRAALFGADTRVDSTQLREWVIQEYISSPLLLDPSPSSNSHGTKFHLRVYVVAVGGLTVYVHHPYLALFASSPYSSPADTATDSGEFDLSAHLTNTCLQTSVLGEEAPAISVATLQGMADKAILSGPHVGEKLGAERIAKIEEGVRETVAEVFKAAVGAGSSFQALPNAFEIFGVDFLVDSSFQVSLLEINACPDFGQTGAELQEVIDHLFACTIDVAIKPFFARQDGTAPADEADALVDTFERLEVGGSRGLKEVLRMQVSRAW